MEPYKLSPTSGTIQDDKIVGRQNEIKHLQKVLESQSVLLKEFRRMGKTLLLKKLAYQSSDKHRAVYFMLQGVSNVSELTDVLLKELRNEQRFGKLRIGWDRIIKLFNSVKPDISIQHISFKLPEFERKWKEAFSACIEDLAERKKDDDETLTLILDEFPIMLWEWIEAGNAKDAIDLLNLLRRLRQEHEADGKIRFIFCGSIGVEVVLDRLKLQHRYTGEAFNDTHKYAMEAMIDEDAMFLCECIFLDGFTLAAKSDKVEVFRLIMQNADNLPVFIHAQFSILRTRSSSVLSVKHVSEAYEIMLTNKDRDYADILDQLKERIRLYYNPEQAGVMNRILNFISREEGTVLEDKIINSLEGEPEQIKVALSILDWDHYLVCNGHPDRKYAFKYPLIKKWWCYNKA